MNGIDALREFGLSEKEAKIYLALLEHGEATALEVSEQTGINRTTIYDVFAALQQKGIVGAVRKGSSLTFHPRDPEFLLYELKKRARVFSQSLPDLRARKGIVKKHPVVEFYQGSYGIDAIYNDIMENAKEIFSYGSFKIIQEVVKYHTQDYRNQRISRGIPTFSVTDATIRNIPEIENKRYRELSTIFINDDLKRMPTWTYIYDDTVAILSCRKDMVFGIRIDDAAIASKERMIIIHLARNAKPFLKGKLFSYVRKYPKPH